MPKTRPQQAAPAAEPAEPARPCFVIGPIGDRLAPIGSPGRDRYEQAIEIYEEVIVPACEAEGFDPDRADYVADGGEIPEQIFEHLRDDDLVIADVTDANPNVMYELGVRHSLMKPTVPVAVYREEQKRPFDIASIRTVEFTRTESGKVDGRKRLQAAIRAVKEGRWQPPTATRVLSAPSGGRRVAETASADSEREVSRSEEPEPLGFLEILADMESAFPEMTETFLALNAEIEAMTELAQRGTDEIKESDEADGGMKGRLLVAARFAERLEGRASAVERLADDYEKELARVDAGMNFIVQSVEEDPAKLGELDEEFRSSVHQMAENAESAFASAEGMAKTYDELGRVSRPIRAQTTRVSAAIRRIGKSGSVMKSWSDRLHAVEDRTENGGSKPPVDATE